MKFADLIPDLDPKGWSGVLLGMIASFIVMIVVHIRTLEDRKLRKESDIQASRLELDDDIELKGRSDHSPRGVVSDISTHTKPKSRRYSFIDCTRGLAISFVTFFHYIWNLRHNEVLPEEYKAPRHALFVEMIEFWIYFLICFILLSELFHKSVFAGYAGFVLVTATCIMWHYWAAQLSGVGIIMFCIGLSSYVQNVEVIQWRKIWTRLSRLALVALSITLVTYIFLPDEFVYFGAIHCITLVSVLHLPFLIFPQYAIWGTLAIFAYKGFIGDFFLEVHVYRNTVDHMPWFENLGYLLFGVFCGHMQVYKASHYIRCMWGRGAPGLHLEDSIFPFLGRHSLFIFVAHQVVLFPLVKLFTGHGLVG
jgi:uncharacterized membrane protein